MSAHPTNPPKQKTIHRTFSAVPGIVKRAIALLSSRALRVWTWLESHTSGWRTTVEQLAEGCSLSLSTAYRGLDDLQAAKLLTRSEEVWTLRLPDSHDCEPVRAQSSSVKESRPTYPSEVGTTGEGGDLGTTVDPNPTANTETNSMTTDDASETPTPFNAPSPHGRDEVPEEVRIRSLNNFLKTWSNEFTDGPSTHRYMTLPAAWQERLLWIRRYWSRDEVFAAFTATVSGNARKAWPYFCACLERIARGEWDNSTSPWELGVVPGEKVEGPRLEGDLLDEVRAQVEQLPMKERIRHAATDLGYDPDSLTPEQRTECIRTALQRAADEVPR